MNRRDTTHQTPSILSGTKVCPLIYLLPHPMAPCLMSGGKVGERREGTVTLAGAA